MSLIQLIDRFLSFFFSSKLSLSSPLFTSGEGGPPAAPGPYASRWQTWGTQVSLPHRVTPGSFPRYLTPTEGQPEARDTPSLALEE